MSEWSTREAGSQGKGEKSIYLIFPVPSSCRRPAGTRALRRQGRSVSLDTDDTEVFRGWPVGSVRSFPDGPVFPSLPLRKVFTTTS